MDLRGMHPAYIDAIERADAGIRLALPQFAEQIGIGETEPSKPIDAETAKATASDLLDIRAALIIAAGRVPLEGNKDLHLRLNGLVNEVDNIGVVLSDRWSS